MTKASSGVNRTLTRTRARVPNDFSHNDALDSFYSFFVNHFADHYAHQLITGHQ